MTNLSSNAASQRVIPIVPIAGMDNDSSAIASLYASDTKIYARSVSGWFNRWRWGMVWLTQLVFYGFPWLSMHGRQALLFVDDDGDSQARSETNLVGHALRLDMGVQHLHG